MFDVEIDLTSARQAYQDFAEDVGDALETAVREAIAEGKAVARVHAPHRSYELRNSIEAFVSESSKSGATGWISAGVPYASFVAEGTAPHTIRPKSKSVLRFALGDGIVFAKQVRHPGTKPNDFMKLAERAAEEKLGASLARLIGIAATKASR